MITKVVMSNVANTTILETDKKTNLIYGLNGTGKSTFSDFLYNKHSSLLGNQSSLLEHNIYH